MNFFFFTIFLLFNFSANGMNLFDKNLSNSETFFTEWEYISDQVMGGVSEGEVEILKEDDTYFLRLSGNVSTKNNGGFIQVRSNKEIESDDFKGIRLKVKGNPSEYHIHIRTSFLLLPWQYYSTEFLVNSDWSYVKVYFSDFEKSNFYQPSKFSPTEIKSIGFVAFGKDFFAELDIMEAQLF